MGLIAVFDIETSHPNKDRARVIEVAYQVLDPETLEVVRAHSTLVFYGDEAAVAIDDAALQVHGITSEMCANEGASIADVVYRMLDDWEDVCTLVSHGADIDVEILALEFVRVLSYWPFADRAIVCTKEIGSFVCCIPRGRDGYKWPSLLELHGCLHGQPALARHDQDHRAAADVELCVQCFRKLRLF